VTSAIQFHAERLAPRNLNQTNSCWTCLFTDTRVAV
jgi:hypothetical protein